MADDSSAVFFFIFHVVGKMKNAYYRKTVFVPGIASAYNIYDPMN